MGKLCSFLCIWLECIVLCEVNEWFDDWIVCWCNGELVVYIFGYQGFWSLDLEVVLYILILCLDIELLVEIVLVIFMVDIVIVFDLGIGIGVIVLVLVSEWLLWMVIVVDCVEEVVVLVECNCQWLFLENVEVCCSYWFFVFDG